MKIVKSRIVFCSILALVISGYSFVYARVNCFYDVSRKHWAYSSLEFLYRNSLIKPLRYFNGTKMAERSFVFKIIFNFIKRIALVRENNYVKFLLEKGIIKGRKLPGVSLVNLALTSNIKRYEIAVIIYRLALFLNWKFSNQDFRKPLFYLNDVPLHHWAARSVFFCYNQGFLIGYPDRKFYGDNYITRYEVVCVLARIFKQFIASKFKDNRKKIIKICEQFEWLRRRYQLGKWDCSMFVKKVYFYLGVYLPRTVILQAKTGRIVTYDSLKCGDLVFFKFRKNRHILPDHVGIFVGRYRGKQKGFFHNSSGKKRVVLSDLKDTWAKRAFLFGRRLTWF